MAKVLSTTRRAPTEWAAPAVAAMSTTVSMGLVGDSIHTWRVSGRRASARAVASVRSTADHSIPRSP